MTELRDSVVEAMAQALYERRRSAFPRWMRWDKLSDDERRQWLVDAEAALDAALDVLGNTEPRYTFVARLLAALRAGKGSDG